MHSMSVSVWPCLSETVCAHTFCKWFVVLTCVVSYRRNWGMIGGSFTPWRQPCLFKHVIFRHDDDHHTYGNMCGDHHLQRALCFSYVNLPIYWCAQAHMGVHCNLHCEVVFMVCSGGGSVYIHVCACARAVCLWCWCLVFRACACASAWGQQTTEKMEK